MIRIGIDVGGTFTDVVAIDAASREIIARVKVPTTHAHADGVAAGIIDGILAILREEPVRDNRVAFIAHSTTQATNALLEGDVARVGILALYGRYDGAVVRAQGRVPPMLLAPGARFSPEFSATHRDDEEACSRAVDAMAARGCTAIAATAPFGVDDPALEQRVVRYASERGLAATSGHAVAATYGLRARTRTAALNAAILPTMVRTARMTAAAAANSGIDAPLMIMRSDGGVMDVGEVERRPILTMLSGPAAGVAGALLHERVTDGIFIEVGGTSSDLSVIRRGRPQMRPARVGNHRTLLRTLDVRTLGVAGGSLLRLDSRRQGAAAVHDVGPRSAHIAGMRYACFTSIETVRESTVTFVRARDGEPEDCAVLVAPRGERIALTPTCAANVLGIVPTGNFAHGDAAAARLAFQRVGERFGMSADALARATLERACMKLRAAIATLIRDYELGADAIDLIGGGGGAAALVPFLAQSMGLPHRIARDAEVISPVGVALALVRDSVERTIANPTPDDILRVRREAIDRVVAAGAAPALVEVAIELDPRRNMVRATASGATEASADAGFAVPQQTFDVRAAAARALHATPEALHVAGEVDAFVAFTVTRRIRQPAWLPIAPVRTSQDACVVDRGGVARLVARHAHVVSLAVGELARRLPQLLEDRTAFGDVGRALPDCSLVYGSRLIDLSGLAESAQVVALAEEELRGAIATEGVLVVLAQRAA